MKIIVTGGDGFPGSHLCDRYLKEGYEVIWMDKLSTSEVYGDPQIHPQNEEYRGNVNLIGVRDVYDEAMEV